MDTFVGITFIVVCFLLIVVVLLQKGRGGGLGAAFGGGGGGSAFGTRTGDVFTWVTIVLTAVFLLLAAIVVMLNVLRAIRGEGATIVISSPQYGQSRQTSVVSALRNCPCADASLRRHPVFHA